MEQNRKFETIWKSIIVPLNYKGYSARANIIRTNNPVEFKVTYEIACSGFSNSMSIDGDIFTINSEKNVNWEVYFFTLDKFAEGYFKPFIDQYNIEMTAMNRGFDVIESKRKCD